MCNINDIKEIYKILIKEKCKNFAFLKCTSAYPTNPKNLIFLQLKIKINSKCNVGLSDHTRYWSSCSKHISRCHNNWKTFSFKKK